MSERVEILSFAYEPLYYADWQTAISDVYSGRAEIIEEHETLRIGVMEGGKLSSIAFPKIVRFKAGAPIKFYNKNKVRFNRSDLYLRDCGTCQYCEKKLSRESATIDHVIPRSKGGQTTWENCVISCSDCNTKKGNKSLSETNMRLLKIPSRPAPTTPYRKR